MSHSKQKHQEETNAVAAMKKNYKYFFKYVKKHAKIKATIGPLTDAIGETIAKTEDICELLRQQYEGVYSAPKQDFIISEPDIFFSVSSNPSLTSIDITTKDILDAAAEIRPNSAAGPDEFPGVVLKRCATQLCIPLQLLWSASLKEGEIPDTTRSARITPIYKGGSRSMPQNYRPVALTSHVIKLFEKILVKKIMNFLEHTTLMNRGQHGFRRGRSCLSQLLEHHTHLLELIEAGFNSDVIHFDFEKAFD